MTERILLGFVVVLSLYSPAVFAGDRPASAQAACDSKCQAKKRGEEAAKLHRQGWEAAIKELQLNASEKKKILDLSTKIEGQLKKAYAARNSSEINRVKKSAVDGLRPILSERLTAFLDAEHWARYTLIGQKTGTSPIVGQTPR